MAAGLRLSRQDVNTLLTEVDTDGNGTVDYEVMSAWDYAEPLVFDLHARPTCTLVYAVDIVACQCAGVHPSCIQHPGRAPEDLAAGSRGRFDRLM